MINVREIDFTGGHTLLKEANVVESCKILNNVFELYKNHSLADSSLYKVLQLTQHTETQASGILEDNLLNGELCDDEKLSQKSESVAMCLSCAGTIEELSEENVTQQGKIKALLIENKEKEEMCDNYETQLFRKDEELKILSDRIEQLQNTNRYRKEVVRLEDVVEKSEMEIRVLKDELECRKKRIVVLEMHETNMTNENKKLKENDKQKQEIEASMLKTLKKDIEILQN